MKKKTLILIIIIAVVLGIGTFLGCFLLLNEKKYTVTFNTDGGSEIGSILVKKNEYITKPNDPTKEGYLFVNWIYNGKTYDFNSKVTSNMELIAKYVEDNNNTFVVIFDSNGGSTVENQVVSVGEKVIKPTDPTKENNEFVCWMLNGEEYDFEKNVDSSFILTAKWQQTSANSNKSTTTKKSSETSKDNNQENNINQNNSSNNSNNSSNSSNSNNKQENSTNETSSKNTIKNETVVEYTCPDGYTSNDNPIKSTTVCSKYVDATISSYKCPSGYEPYSNGVITSSTICVNYSISKSADYCAPGYTDVQTGCKKDTPTSIFNEQQCNTAGYQYESDGCHMITNYLCNPNYIAYDVSGTQINSCILKTAALAVYNCSSGTLSESKCILTIKAIKK